MQAVLNSSAAPPEVPERRPVFIGIDWADKAHAVCVIDPERSTPQHSTLEHKPDAIVAWARALQQKYSDRELRLIIEQSRGALIHALIEVGGFTIYPINPKQTVQEKSTGKGDLIAKRSRQIHHGDTEARSQPGEGCVPVYSGDHWR
jgi:Transposase